MERSNSTRTIAAIDHFNCPVASLIHRHRTATAVCLVISRPNTAPAHHSMTILSTHSHPLPVNAGAPRTKPVTKNQSLTASDSNGVITYHASKSSHFPPSGDHLDCLWLAWLAAHWPSSPHGVIPSLPHYRSHGHTSLDQPTIQMEIKIFPSMSRVPASKRKKLE